MIPVLRVGEETLRFCKIACRQKYAIQTQQEDLPRFAAMEFEFEKPPLPPGDTYVARWLMQETCKQCGHKLPVEGR